jgi:hypothetical protein
MSNPQYHIVTQTSQSSNQDSKYHPISKKNKSCVSPKIVYYQPQPTYCQLPPIHCISPPSPCPSPPCPSPPCPPQNDSYVEIKDNITCNTTWYTDVTYNIIAEVHVKAPAVLTIQKRAKVTFKNGFLGPDVLLSGGLLFASLVIDSGASIHADTVQFSNEIEMNNNCGSLIILGTLEDEFPYQFEDYQTIVSNPIIKPGYSTLRNVSFTNTGANSSDINGLTLFKVKGNEITMSNIGINNAGDDALEIFGGKHTIDSLEILVSVDDGIDLDYDAELTITKQLSIKKINTVPNTPGLIEVIGALNTQNTL